MIRIGAIVASIIAPIEGPIHIKHVHSSPSYKLATYPKYDRPGRESPSGRGPLECLLFSAGGGGFKSVMVVACLALNMKREPQNITGQPGVSIM